MAPAAWSSADRSSATGVPGSKIAGKTDDADGPLDELLAPVGQMVLCADDSELEVGAAERGAEIGVDIGPEELALLVVGPAGVGVPEQPPRDSASTKTAAVQRAGSR